MAHLAQTASPLGGASPSVDWIALMGRRDVPTDGIEDYCTYLAGGLKIRGIHLGLNRVQWDVQPWRAALRQLRRESGGWTGKWVLLQYTALSWSRRGFPFRVLAVLHILKRIGGRVAVVLHEPSRQARSPRRWIDRLRGACQDWVIRRLYVGAEKTIFTVPLETVPWLPASRSKAAFIPIGPNLPECSLIRENSDTEPRRIAVFGLTGHDIAYEVSQIQSVVNQAKERIPRLELTVLGRGSVEARTALEKAFAANDVKLSILGILPGEQLAHHLASADALLFVRGSLSLRRGTLLAAMACGLPIVGYDGPETDLLIREAGVEAASSGDIDGLAAALTHVLSDDKFRQKLRKRSKSTYERHFSWDRIAEQFVGVLSND